MKIVTIDKIMKIPNSYKFYPNTIKKLKDISKSQGKPMTSVLEFLIHNFDDLRFKDGKEISIKKVENDNQKFKYPKTYKLYSKTTKLLDEISKSQGETKTTVLEFLIHNFDNLELKEDTYKTNVK